MDLPPCHLWDLLALLSNRVCPGCKLKNIPRTWGNQRIRSCPIPIGPAHTRLFVFRLPLRDTGRCDRRSLLDVRSCVIRLLCLGVDCLSLLIAIPSSHGATGMSMLGCLCNKDGQGPVISDSNRPRSRSRERSEGNKSDKSDGKKENSQADGEDSPPYGRSFEDTSDRAPVARPLVKFSVSDFLLLIIMTSGRSHSALRPGLSQLSSECQNRTSLPICFFGC